MLPGILQENICFSVPFLAGLVLVPGEPVRANSNHQRTVYQPRLKTVRKLKTFGSGGERKKDVAFRVNDNSGGSGPAYILF